MDSVAQEILDFWFGEVGSDTYGKARQEWFVKSDTYDDEIRQRFGTTVQAAIAGDLTDWTAIDATVRQTLAYIVLLDQFPRNIYRNTGAMYDGDVRALTSAQRLVLAGADKQLEPIERVFCYLPYEHSEDMAVQHESLRLFGQLVGESAGGEFIEYAKKHFEIVERFGRYPHRNALLGRESTAEELEFLSQPGSSF